jgi:hypothetical protein
MRRIAVVITQSYQGPFQPRRGSCNVPKAITKLGKTNKTNLQVEVHTRVNLSGPGQ